MSTQKTRDGASMDSIRAKLWSCGFKVSSHTIKNFVDYIADQEETMYDSDTSDMQSTSTTEDIHLPTKTPSHTTTDHNGTSEQSMEHRLTILEQEIASLQHKVDAYIAQEEKEQDDGYGYRILDMHPHHETIADSSEPLHQGLQETPPKGRPKHARKSDPVSMYHKMQSLWCKNKFLAHHQSRN